jgi:UDP-N-acetylmuramoylalanine--D-glutamate ligase
VIAWDRQDDARNALQGRAELDDPLTIDLSDFDGVVVSPGVPLNTHPIAKHASRFGVPVIGDIELFAQARGNLPPHNVIGITGTNGKSTTTALVKHILESAGVPALMGGNIGLPILGQNPLPDGGVYVLELSSYQIDLTQSLDCDAAGLTNITPDHLDRYDSFEAYAASKAMLFAMQEDDKFACFGCGDAPTLAVAEAEQARRPEGRVAIVDGSQIIGHQSEWLSLQGPHNLENAAIATALVEELGLTRDQVLDGLASFRGLPHRMEVLGTHQGVLFVNDSKATNPASSAPALAAFPPNPEPRIHWICGGLPKGDDLGECAGHLENVAGAYTIGEAGPIFAELLEPHVPVERAEMLSEAVNLAIKAAKPGNVILFSPACASFDQFRNYEVRGDAFRDIVLELANDAERAAG